MREEVRDALLAFEDPELGSPIRAVLRSEEIFRGRFAKQAPDLIAIPNDLWVLDHTALAATELEYPTGDHRREGVIAAAGASIPRVDLGVRELADIAPTALAWCDTAPPGDFDGSAIEQLLGRRTALTSQAARRTDPVPVRDRADADLTDEEAELITHHLRDLGYVDG